VASATRDGRRDRRLLTRPDPRAFASRERDG